MADPFRKRPKGPVLSAEAAQRQGKILHVAISALGASEAIAFLNAEHPQLGGRPLDLALASADGYAKVAGFLQIAGEA